MTSRLFIQQMMTYQASLPKPNEAKRKFNTFAYTAHPGYMGYGKPQSQG
jgi:hypothetical protein